MTFEELHKILDNPNRQLTPAEFAEIIYKLKKDTFQEAMKLYDYDTDICSQKLQQWYFGETNAFQIVLDLLEHLKE